MIASTAQAAPPIGAYRLPRGHVLVLEPRHDSRSTRAWLDQRGLREPRLSWLKKRAAAAKPSLRTTWPPEEPLPTRPPMPTGTCPSTWASSTLWRPWQATVARNDQAGLSWSVWSWKSVNGTPPNPWGYMDPKWWPLRPDPQSDYGRWRSLPARPAAPVIMIAKGATGLPRVRPHGVGADRDPL